MRCDLRQGNLLLSSSRCLALAIALLLALLLFERLGLLAQRLLLLLLLLGLSVADLRAGGLCGHGCVCCSSMLICSNLGAFGRLRAGT